MSRSEAEIFAELQGLCSSSGYAHVLAYLCFRDNTILYSGELSGEDIQPHFSGERLIRTELSTLIGLMMQAPLSLERPTTEDLQNMVNRTQELLVELHHAMLQEAFDEAPLTEARKLPQLASYIREPIFYGGDSAHDFQYRELSLSKYAADEQWLIQNKGFSISDAHRVVTTICDIVSGRIHDYVAELRRTRDENWSFLPCFIVSTSEIEEQTPIDPAIVANVLMAFSTSDVGLEEFASISDFNPTTAFPLLRLKDGQFLVFQTYSLVEALYETPFYWMVTDDAYRDTAMENRGDFTEQVAAERLVAVFGEHRVHQNVQLCPKRGDVAGEIDVLVVFGNRAIVLQAKSKRLTLESRKGNDGVVRDDFKKAIQSSYEQGFSCAEMLLRGGYRLEAQASSSLDSIGDLEAVYIFCLVADHYPALASQAREFLQLRQGQANIHPPFVMDLFLLDLMCEFLTSPLYFLSYIDRRVRYHDKIFSMHEQTILGYHLRSNLWLDEDEHDGVFLHDDVGVDLDAAFLARREGVSGATTPEGILTRLQQTTVGEILRSIQNSEDPSLIDLGFLFLAMSEEAVLATSDKIDTVVQLHREDGRSHDLTTLAEDGHAGLTVHCTSEDLAQATAKLEAHCLLRKYRHKATQWFGLLLDGNLSIRAGLKLAFPWSRSAKMDRILAEQQRETASGAVKPSRRTGRIGRNAPCPCGSGSKFKRCCLRKKWH